MVHYTFLHLIFLCYFVLPLLAEDERQHKGNCPTYFNCSQFGELQFPFTNTSNLDCGLLIKGCDDQNAHKNVPSSNGTWFRLESIKGNNSISVLDLMLLKYLNSGSCNAFTYDFNATLPPSSPILHFQVKMEHSITVLRCKQALDSEIFNFYKNCDGYDIYYPVKFSGIHDMYPGSENACSTIQLPIKSSSAVDNFPDLYSLLSAKFTILILVSEDCRKCHENGTQCQVDNGLLHCASSKGEADPPQPKQAVLRVVTILKIGLVATGFLNVIILSLIILFFYKRRNSLPDIQIQSNKVHCSPNQNSIPESGSVFFGIPVFSYTELEIATTNFDEARELGSGGFGTVYYGKLHDGREVAVKRLYEHNYRRMEQFTNEIEILTRLRHRNLVSLYGCSSRHSRELLLVYEYIPNGTVACHLHGDLAKTGFLTWPIRMKIAIETASALTYLHASGIIHRDVKTNNILLDNYFCVKVADFGLSRLFPNNATHVSTAPQGTPGYVDPAYHQCYQLTSKSDVYSFGVVLIELISSLKAVDITRDTDEINLSKLAIKKIKNRAFSELVDPSLGFELDKEVKRKILAVAELAFQCLQEDKDLRPSMVEVLETLKRTEGGENKPSI
ncbi:hypothetical protein VNO77_41841 [Canavalia gladiata]|uniref:Protein kinase domain-containing protein n=1 Tax=Canavalia gladiata TaxID=3824 RepID=A0AAN9PS62_CANGL